MILYGQIGSRKFAELHSALKAKASKGLIKYIVRHYLGAEPNKNKQTNKLRLSGYGVELQIKSSEYKAQDDRKVNADGQELNAEHNNAGLFNNYILFFCPFDTFYLLRFLKPNFFKKQCSYS